MNELHLAAQAEKAALVVENAERAALAERVRHPCFFVFRFGFRLWWWGLFCLSLFVHRSVSHVFSAPSIESHVLGAE
jgi:hypothetical protein